MEKAVSDTVKEHIHIFNDLLKTNASVIDSRAWSIIHFEFIDIERDHDHELNEKESVVVDNIMKAVTNQAHELNTGQRNIHANTFIH